MRFFKKSTRSREGSRRKLVQRDSNDELSQSLTSLKTAKSVADMGPEDILRLVSRRKFSIVDEIVARRGLEDFKSEYLREIRPKITTLKRQPSLLHYACTLQPPLSTIELLTELEEDALSKTNSKGWCPLHVACHYRASSNVIRYLVNKDPTSVKLVDNSLRTALHLVVQNSDVDPRVVKILVTSYPSIIKMEDSFGNTALEQAFLEGKVGMKCINMANTAVKEEKKEKNELSLSLLIPRDQ